jgi:hypothetical protein
MIGGREFGAMRSAAASFNCGLHRPAVTLPAGIQECTQHHAT